MPETWDIIVVISVTAKPVVPAIVDAQQSSNKDNTKLDNRTPGLFLP